MAKKKENRVRIVCPEYKGYLDEMPEELKAERELRLKNKLKK